MHLRLWCILAFVIFPLCPHTMTFGRVLRPPKTRGFLLYRTNSISQRPCTCSTTFSCSCCETVTLLYSKRQKTLCSNFMYQRNGLNADISLDRDTVKTTTVSIYRPFKLCSAIPGSLFSSICVNVIELNQFPRSLTVCVRHEIMSKVQEWQINYICVSISTELPIMGSGTMTSGMISMTTVATTAATTVRPSSQMATTMRPSSQMATTMRPSSQMAMATGAMTTKPPATTGSAMSSMPSGSPPTGTAGPPSMTAIVGARRRRRESGLKFYNTKIINKDQRVKIVNDNKLGSPNRRWKDSMPVARPLLETSNSNTATSGESANGTFSILVEFQRNATFETNERIVTPGGEVFHNRTEYFPSRIPPEVAKTLEEKSSVNTDSGHVLFGTENSFKDRLIFPN